jgi:hypothetical protein
MKKIILVLFLSLSVQALFACDICGCSSGNYFLGPTPQFRNHFIGMRYSFRSFSTVMKEDESEFSNDFYQTAELWQGFKIKNKFQVLTFFPFNINHSLTDDGKKINNGLGDVTVIGNYNLFDNLKLNSDTETVNQQLWIGAGVKIPTGKFSPDEEEIVSSANSQAGTGSVDFLITASYSLVADRNGFTGNVNYKINQQAHDFKFGNRFTTSAFIFRSFNCKKIAVSPNIGLLYENLEANEFAEVKIEDTTGGALLAAAGFENRIDKMTIGFNAQLPLVQNISDEQTKITWRGMIHLTYAF